MDRVDISDEALAKMRARLTDLETSGKERDASAVATRNHIREIEKHRRVEALKKKPGGATIRDILSELFR